MEVVAYENLMDLTYCSVFVETLPLNMNCDHVDFVLQHNFANARNYLNQILNHNLICGEGLDSYSLTY